MASPAPVIAANEMRSAVSEYQDVEGLSQSAAGWRKVIALVAPPMGAPIVNGPMPVRSIVHVFGSFGEYASAAPDGLGVEGAVALEAAVGAGVDVGDGMIDGDGVVGAGVVGAGVGAAGVGAATHPVISASVIAATPTALTVRTRIRAPRILPSRSTVLES
jgi:hypothetical protein